MSNVWLAGQSLLRDPLFLYSRLSFCIGLYYYAPGKSAASQSLDRSLSTKQKVAD